MSRDLGIPAGTPPPPALRVARPGWRDPRLWLGLLLVAGSVVLGARVMAAADDTTAVWVVRADLGAGAPLDDAALTTVRVRFADEATARRYLPADRPVPTDAVVRRAVGAGELLARAAVGPPDDVARLRVPIEVDPNRVPPGVGVGAVVDVWVSGAGASAGAAGAAAATDGAPSDGAGVPDGPALAGVTVLAAPAGADTFAVTGARQIVVAVDEQSAAAFERLLAGLDDPVVRVLQRS